jgi:hypothetical protein
VEVMCIDISGPPDVGGKRSQVPEFSSPRPRAGAFLWRGAKPNPARGNCKTWKKVARAHDAWDPQTAEHPHRARGAALKGLVQEPAA